MQNNSRHAFKSWNLNVHGEAKYLFESIFLYKFSALSIPLLIYIILHRFDCHGG